MIVEYVDVVSKDVVFENVNFHIKKEDGDIS